MLQASGRLSAGAGTPAAKAVSPPPIAPPTSPARNPPTTSRLAFAPFTVPNSSELTTADITSFAVFTAASQPIRIKAMASRHLARSRLAQSHSMIAIPAPKAMPACSGIPAALMRMPGFSEPKIGQGRRKAGEDAGQNADASHDPNGAGAGGRLQQQIGPQDSPGHPQSRARSKRASPLPSWSSPQGEPGGSAARTRSQYTTGRPRGTPIRVSVLARVVPRRNLV